MLCEVHGCSSNINYSMSISKCGQGNQSHGLERSSRSSISLMLLKIQITQHEDLRGSFMAVKVQISLDTTFDPYPIYVLIWYLYNLD